MPEKLKNLIEYAGAIVNTLEEPLLILDKDLRVLFANRSFFEKFMVSEKDTLHQEIYSLGNGQWNIPELRKLLGEVLPMEKSISKYEMTHEFPGIGEKTMLVSGRVLEDAAAGSILVVIEDATDRKIMEEKLRVSEVRYRKLFETAKDGIILIDPLTEKIIDVNPYLLEMIGYSLQEIIGKKLWEVGTFKNIDQAKKAFEELQEKKFVRFEDLPMLTRDGREIAVEFVSNLYPINAVSMIQCNVRNITDRKIAEGKAKAYLDGIERVNAMMTGRELKMVELKAEIEKLKDELLEK